MMARVVVIYKTRFQQTLALISIEAEFVSALDAGKYSLCIRSVLEDLDELQESATVIYEDNVGEFLMADAVQSTQRTQYIDIRHFALLDCVKQYLI